VPTRGARRVAHLRRGAGDGDTTDCQPWQPRVPAR